MKTTAQIIATILMFGLFVVAIGTGFEKQDRIDCYRWQSEAAQYPSYYLTPNQAAQCTQLGITIHTQVK